MTDILGIVGSVSDSSKTRAAVERALAGAEAEFGVSTDVLHLAEYDLETADGRPLADYTGATAEALDTIVDSEAYLIGTPVYRASYSGALKNLLDLVPRGTWMADVAPFEASAIGLVATGATPHHYLAVDEQLRPLMGFFGAYTVGGVYAHGEQFDEGPRVTDEALAERLGTLGKATWELSTSITEGTHLARLGPQI